MNKYLIFALGASLIAILYAMYLALWTVRQYDGNEKMKEIASAIQEGAKAYLNRQYKTIFGVALIVSGILFWALGGNTALGFIVGALASASAGFIGMYVSVKANIRTAEAARDSMDSALRVAVRGGSVTGLMV